MPIKPSKLENIARGFVNPFAQLKLGLLHAVSEPKIPNTGKVPFNISTKMINRLSKDKLDDFANLVIEQATNAKNTYKKVDPVLSSLYQDILNNVVFRNGKAYVRNKDSFLNSIKKIDGETINDLMKAGVPPTAINEAIVKNSPFYGRKVGGSDKILDMAFTPGDSMQNYALYTSAIAGKAARDVGMKLKYPILVNAGDSVYTKPSQFVPQRGELVLNRPFISTPVHELSHAKDFKSSIISRNLPIVGDTLSTASLIGSPLSILYGDKIADAIPGKADDALISAMKYAGPEIWLAGQAMRHYPEFYATKNTKDIIRKNKQYYEGLMSAMPGGGQSIDTLIENQDAKARTYPSSVISRYGLLRLGTLPLYLSKESSAAPKITVTPADYANVAKNEILRRVRSIKNLAIGMTDKEIWKGLLYHDSANKYTPISKVLPVSTLAAMVPLVALGEYYKDQIKPPPVIPGPSYKDSIKQGLGA
jgi:hypothetical protein